MPNLMDSTPFNNNIDTMSQQNIEALIQQIKQNPSMFEEQIRRNNPQAYQMALQIRNSPNPRAIIMQMMQAKGFNPNILGMLGIK
jgi:hypothetical protein